MHKFTEMEGVSVTLAGRAEMQERADMRSAEGLEDRMLTPGQVEALKVVLKVSWLTMGDCLPGIIYRAQTYSNAYQVPQYVLKPC